MRTQKNVKSIYNFGIRVSESHSQSTHPKKKLNATIVGTLGILPENQIQNNLQYGNILRFRQPDGLTWLSFLFYTLF